VHRQLTSQISRPDGGRVLVVSATKELEPRARAMLLLADELFRLDVLVNGDALEPYVRNLSRGGLTITDDPEGTESSLQGGAAELFGGRAALCVRGIGEAGGFLARVSVATVRVAERGTIAVSAQAIIRDQAPS
jgi:hypothetical protein